MTTTLTAVDLVTLGKRAREDAEEALLVLPRADMKRRRTATASPTLPLKKLILAAVNGSETSPAKLTVPKPVDPDVIKELKKWAKGPGYVLQYKEGTKKVPERGSVRNETVTVPVYRIKVYW